MSTQIRIENSVKITRMSVAGADLKLPKDHKYFVNLELDYTDVSREDLMDLASGGSSVRVKAQAKLRGMEAKLKEQGQVGESASEFEDDDLGWIKFHVATDFEKEASGPRDPAKTVVSAYSKMTDGQKVEFIMEQMGLSEEDAIAAVGIS